MHRPWFKALSLVTILALVLLAFPLPSAIAATPTDLFFSEYIEGSSNNKALEIYNGTGAAINLATGGYSVQMFFNGSATAGLTINLTGIVADGDVFVLAQSSANAAILAQADQTDSAGWFNGDDAVILRKGTTVIDAIGQIGVDPGSEWGTGLVSTADNTLRRKATVCAGDPDGSNAFDPSVEWDGFATDTFAGLGAHTASCGAIATPSLSINDVAVNEGNTGSTNFTFTVSLSAPAGAGGVTFDIATADNTATAGSDYVAYPLTGRTIPAGSQTHSFTVQVYGDTTAEPDETFFVNVTNVAGATLADGQGQGTIVNDDVAVTFIHDIQGSTDTAAPGTFTVEAIVVGDYQTQGSGQLRGFFIQEEDADADANPATSEGIFVFCSSCPRAVSVGDKVRVTGASSEYFGMSQLTASTLASVNVLSSSNPLPTSATLELPVPGVPTGDLAAATAVINAYYEAFEGMLVTFPDTLTVSEYFELARYGQVILTEGGRPHTFTAVYAPSVTGLINHEINLATRQVILDDTDNRQNRPVDTPNTPYYHPYPGLSTTNYFRGGDTITNLTGVLHWSFAGQSGTDAWRIRPVTEAYSYAFTPVNPRPTAPAVAGSLKVASFNVLNYFLTIDTSDVCAPTQNQDCRGADSAQELDRQRTKLLAALSGLNADVVGVMEMENTPGVEPLADITAGLPGYSYIDTGVIGGDAIRVGILYKTATVTPVGSYAILDSTVDPRFKDTSNRPALAQSFMDTATGGIFTVAVNHLKSKGSACSGDPDLGDGAGNCNQTRKLAAQALADWLANDPTGSGDGDALIIGDLNSYAMEDPIVALQNAGYTNLVALYNGPEAYGYVFDAQLGYLDHALSNASLTPQVKGVAEWHINADEIPLFDYNDDARTADEAAFEEESDVLPLYQPNEFRTSDHDPIIIGLDVCDEIAPTLEVSVTPNVLWPANHKYVDVTATVTAADNFDPNPTVTLVSVTSNEPDNGDDDGDTIDDIVIVDDYNFKLRAERSGLGTGRIYTITYQVTDACGNTTTQSATVTVPLSQGK